MSEGGPATAFLARLPSACSSAPGRLLASLANRRSSACCCHSHWRSSLCGQRAWDRLRHVAVGVADDPLGLTRQRAEEGAPVGGSWPSGSVLRRRPARHPVRLYALRFWSWAQLAERVVAWHDGACRHNTAALEVSPRQSDPTGPRHPIPRVLSDTGLWARHDCRGLRLRACRVVWSLHIALRTFTRY